MITAFDLSAREIIDRAEGFGYSLVLLDGNRIKLAFKADEGGLAALFAPISEKPFTPLVREIKCKKSEIIKELKRREK